MITDELRKIYSVKGELVGLPRARWPNTWHSRQDYAGQVGKRPAEDAALWALLTPYFFMPTFSDRYF
jgi:hypothetical protein